jgi:hypothetical protein
MWMNRILPGFYDKRTICLIREPVAGTRLANVPRLKQLTESMRRRCKKLPASRLGSFY